MRCFLHLLLTVAGIAGGLFIFGTIFLTVRDYLTRRRKKDREEDFIYYFTEKGISESPARSVYRHLQDWTNFKDFPVRPGDELGDVYGIFDEGLDDMIVEIAAAAALEIPADPKCRRQPIVTVDDSTRFVASFPRKIRSTSRRAIANIMQ